MSEFTVVVKGGIVVSPQGMTLADVGIKGEKVVRVAANLNTDGTRVIDATGKVVIPGAIDVHTHPVYTEDMGGMSITAAYGGVTTMIHYGYVKPNQKVIPTLEWFRDEGLSKSYLDFSLHGGLFDVEHQLADVPAAFKMGVTSFKVFMTYAKLKWMTDDYWMTALMDVVAQERGLSMVHAENGLATDYLEDKFNREGRSPVDTFTDVRPALLEAEAFNRAMLVAQVMGSALYVVHNSAEACMEPLRRAQRNGWKVWGETCPQYLTLTKETTQKFKAQAKMGPPLRTKEDNEALWQALADGTLSTIGSDSAPKAKKVDDDFFAAPYGAPAIETMLRMVFHEGVNKGRITLPKLVEVMCENPARIFGLYPKKGCLLPGSDADLVLIDPTRKEVITASNLHSGAGFTLYEGREVMGMTTLVMQRGSVVMDDGKIVGKAGHAQYMPTDTSHLYQ